MPPQKPAKGKLLIAEPFLRDPNFERSVVFVCEHNERGTFGLVFNQTTNLFLNDVLQEPVANSLPLYLGGPVEQNTLHFLHRLPFIEDTKAERRSSSIVLVSLFYRCRVSVFYWLIGSGTRKYGALQGSCYSSFNGVIIAFAERAIHTKKLGLRFFEFFHGQNQ
mgnify:CR=1 FL=1